jgi:hypothetical protein
MGLVFPFFFDLPQYDIVLPIDGASGDKLQNLEKFRERPKPENWCGATPERW